MSGLQRRDDGLLLQLSSAEIARIDALSARLGLNGLTDDSVGAVIGRPVRIAVLDASLLARQFWLMLTVLAPSWELVAVGESVEDLQAQLAEIGDDGGRCRPGQSDWALQQLPAHLSGHTGYLPADRKATAPFGVATCLASPTGR